nr:immunoglobulin heavy chain junction region [Macaca mulatta]MOW98660.1 immunoglobulin heavy chain junction region [Macaca mulatta]MOW98675.1 immunoglobulin heavy chain junction region [Macaca mulatta]MOW98698.1 immunoglobulin heavy chain junction region [Macaca mulatta]MOW98711.1 immunoglobulin heavy chain junction region [Macaca mulatta]
CGRIGKSNYYYGLDSW